MPESTTASVPRLLVGAALLLAAVAAAAILVGQHLNALALPGCGPGSGCAQAAASAWGRVPGLGWPVSIVGLAWFLGALVAWLAARGATGTGFRWLVRLGAVLSLVFIGAMIAGGYLCPYCIAAHVAHLGFWVVMETGPRGRASIPPLPVAVAVTVLAAVVLLIVDRGHRATIEREQQEQLEQSTQAAIERSRNPDEPGEPFIGRWTVGPAVAPIRLVVISDYQCPDCKRVEGEIRELMAERDDILLSAKHFPMNGPCNRFIQGRGPHRNACWAARAAEAAGIIDGNDGFWRMHHWLFDRGGSFTNAELTAALPGLGFDPDAFIQVMMSDETLERVQADIEEANVLGLHFTPMVFLNGVEVKGWTRPGAVRSAVEALARTNPEPRGPEYDAPVRAARKYIEDWQDQNVQAPAGLENGHARGPEDAPIRVVMWGDLQESGTGRAHRRILERIDTDDDVRYVFLHYPFDQTCNPYASSTAHEHACLAAKAAEAAARLDGEDGFWRMVDALIERREELRESTLATIATDAGFDGDALVHAMEHPMVSARVVRCASASRGLSPPMRFIPTILVNGRWVPRWNLDGEDILGEIFDLAARGE